MAVCTGSTIGTLSSYNLVSAGRSLRASRTNQARGGLGHRQPRGGIRAIFLPGKSAVLPSKPGFSLRIARSFDDCSRCRLHSPGEVRSARFYGDECDSAGQRLHPRDQKSKDAGLRARVTTQGTATTRVRSGLSVCCFSRCSRQFDRSGNRKTSAACFPFSLFSFPFSRTAMGRNATICVLCQSDSRLDRSGDPKARPMRQPFSLSPFPFSGIQHG